MPEVESVFGKAGRADSATDPAPLEIALNQIPGVVENGLFTREAAGMVVGCFDGTSYVKMR